MEIIKGTAVSGGIALGRIQTSQPAAAQEEDSPAGTPEQELERFRWAVGQAAARLDSLYQSALSQAGEEAAEIFRVQKQMQGDRDLLEAVYIAITCQGKSALQAVRQVERQFSAAFRAIDSAYMQARADDVADICRRLAGILSGSEEETVQMDGPGILAVEELMPSQIAALDSRDVLGIVSRKGGVDSHAAILARAMGIPVLTGVELPGGRYGQMAALDGGAGLLYLEPDRETWERLEELRFAADRQRANWSTLGDGPAATRDGRQIDLLANLGSPDQAPAALRAGAQGIGLFRTELLFLSREELPGEEDQFCVYRRVVQEMSGRRVVFRTLDVGGDKQLPYLQGDGNALGLRGIRLCLRHREILRTQLRALLRASAFGPVAVMFPMVTSQWEVEQAKAELELCRTQLEREGAALGQVEVGVMIETPAAVEIAPELAGLVDFFSLGTNDLTQYTLAVDRRDADQAGYYDPQHPAVLRQIARTVAAGRRAGRWVCVCGELAADPQMAQWFLEQGVDGLSMAPASIGPVRERIGTLDLSAAAAP